jgi:hypothetical protein
MLELEPIDQKYILQVQIILSKIDSLIITQVIFSILKALCLFVKNSYFISILDSVTINLVNIAFISLATSAIITKSMIEKINSHCQINIKIMANNKAGINIDTNIFKIDILYSALKDLS